MSLTRLRRSFRNFRTFCLTSGGEALQRPALIRAAGSGMSRGCAVQGGCSGGRRDAGATRGPDRPGPGGARGGGHGRARASAARGRQPVVAVPRRRAGRLPASARDLPPAPRHRRPGHRGRLAASRRETRSAGDPPLPLRHRRRARTSTSTPSSPPPALHRGARRRRRARQPLRRGAARAEARRGPSAAAQGRGPLVPRDRRAVRLVLHESEPGDHRGPPPVHQGLHGDRVGRGVRPLRPGPRRPRARESRAAPSSSRSAPICATAPHAGRPSASSTCPACGGSSC